MLEYSKTKTMRITVLLISILLLFGACRSRKLSKNTEVFVSEKQETISKSEESEVIHEAVKELVAEKAVDQKTDSRETDVDISGKAEPEKPFTFHEVEKGDTLRSIVITGSADFKIITRQKSQNHTEQTATAEKETNAVQQLARAAVSEDNIVRAAHSLQSKADELSSRNATASTWGALTVMGIGVVFVVAAVIYFKR